MNTALRLFVPTLLTLVAAGSAAAADAPAAPTDDVRAVLELFRSDVNAAKTLTLNEVMKLSEEESAKFWPIYREYEVELAALGERKLGLIRQFLTHSSAGSLDDANSAAIAEGWLDLQQDRLDLWRKYYKKISRAVSPMRGGQFLQVEHQMALFIDLNIAAEMPAVGAAGG
jgi:hypothetical protein